MVYWEPAEFGLRGPYRVHFRDNDDQLPVEFINDNWYALTLEDNRYRISPEHRLERGELGTGWWHEEDKQHPTNQRNQELMQPRENRPIDETTDDSSSEALEDPPSPPPNYGRRSPTVEEQREEDLLVELTRVQATIAATTTQTMTKVTMGEPGPSRPPGGGQPEGTPGRWPGPINIGQALGRGPPRGGPPGGGPEQPNQPFPQAGNNGGGSLQGMPPWIFTGDRNLSEMFMREWSLYYLINSDADRMATPFKRVALCLSFFKGLKVDSWVMLQIGWLQNVTTRQHNPIAPQDPRLWDIFEAEFWRAFMDTAREQNADKKLVALKMSGGDLNTYIADFEKLAQDAGYHLNEKGALILFRRGLPYGLHKVVVDKVHPAPVTIDQWQWAAREQQGAYVDWRAKMGEAPRTPPECHQCWRSTLDQWNNRRWDPDAIDVDAIEINSLTKDEKDEYSPWRKDCASTAKELATSHATVPRRKAGIQTTNNGKTPGNGTPH
jgi:hypothetical protein